MEDLLLQEGCLKAYATFCLCGFWKDLIYELILFAFMYFSCVGLVLFMCWTCIWCPGLVFWGFGLVLGVCLVVGCLSSSWVSV